MVRKKGARDTDRASFILPDFRVQTTEHRVRIHQCPSCHRFGHRYVYEYATSVRRFI